MTGAIRDETLHAYIDGELSQAEHAAVERAEKDDPLLARRIALYRADKMRLAATWGDIAQEPVPDAWLAAMARGVPRRRVSMRVLAGIAASLLVLLGGLAIYRLAMPREESIIAEALAARQDTLPARETITVNSAGAAAYADRAVRAVLAMPAHAPDLLRLGYRLTGAKIYADVPGGKAIELIYRDAGGAVVTLYARRPNGPVRFDQFKQGNLRVCIWQDDTLGTVVTGQTSAPEMQRLASLAYAGLEF